MANLLREFRQALGLSRTELGALLHRSPATLEKYESDIPNDLAEACRDLARDRQLDSYVEQWTSYLAGVPEPTSSRGDVFFDRIQWILRRGDRRAVASLRYLVDAIAQNEERASQSAG